jgi:hypothetical protein
MIRKGQVHGIKRGDIIAQNRDCSKDTEFLWR